MDLEIAGRAALVTGASQGLGFASALALAAEGADVAITGRDAERLSGAAERIKSETGRVALVVPGDITGRHEPGLAVQATVERFGRLDILVANAGGPPPKRALEVTTEDIDAAVNANLATTVRLVQQALPHLREAGQGRVCAITSHSVLQPIPSLSLSNLARAGLWGWAKTAAKELSADGVTLNLICPGKHKTERLAELGVSGPAGDPADFGKVVAFLCSGPARYISATTIVVDGGEILGL